MPKIKITCDSTCDLNAELYHRYGISVIPMSVAMGDKLCRDGVDTSADDIFAYVTESGQLPKTSAVSVCGRLMRQALAAGSCARN